MARLRVCSLEVKYGSRRALHCVSFDVGNGVTGLLGPNGAGKSTLLRSIATAQLPNSGSILIAGVEATDPRNLRDVRRGIGYLPQSTGLYPNLSVEQFVHYVSILKEIAGNSARRDETHRVLNAVGLYDRRREKVKKLSGGMQQRLALACALLADPPVLVLDEPTVGLDPEQRLRFREIIAELGRNRAVLLSTHQTDDVASVCSRVIVLHRGAVLFNDTPRNLARQASGMVWEADERAGEALAAWGTGEGTVRNIGVPPPDARLVTPTLDDGYLVLMARVDAGAPVTGIPA